MDPQAQTADILIHPGWIVPVIPRGAVLENYSIALTGDRITALLPRRNPSPPDRCWSCRGTR
jgi:5-methylthioadenosine/S-adenosylhomocysteine deaminase